MRTRISISHAAPLLTLSTLLLLITAAITVGAQDTVPQGGETAPGALLRPGSNSLAPYAFPPYLEVDHCCPLEPVNTQEFAPIRGGLPLLRANAGGRTCGITVNLARGDAAYLPEPDFLLRSPTGSDATYQRSFRTDRARAGYGSPGLSPGWVHNYDIVIENVSQANAGVPWQPLKLVYPNGEHDLLQPELDSDGEPTGRLLTAGNLAFAAQGKPADVPGHWRSITLRWRDDTTWVFAPYSSNSYFLDRLDTLTLDWDDDRRLISVADVATHDKMLILHYDARGLLSWILDRAGHIRRYQFDAPPKGAHRNQPPRLISVSQPTAAGVVRAPARWEYDYSSVSAAQMLWRVRQIESPGRDVSQCYIGYHNDRVSAVTDRDGVDHVFTYAVGSTRVTLQDQDRTVRDFWTQRLDARGRNSGFTDLQGRSTVVNYE